VQRNAALRTSRGVAAFVVVISAAAFAACGSSASSSSATKSVVTAPDFTLQGCTFEVNNSIPTGEPPGVRPNFPSFAPDPSANAALDSIEKHGGTAMIDSAAAPEGTVLYAGPDRSGTVIGTVPSGQSVLLAEPLLWTDKSGQTWFAFFLECGGPNLYWASLDQIKKVNPTAGKDLVSLIKQLAADKPYPQSDQASLVPVKIVGGKLTWTSPSITFDVGRGQLINNL
jgi:hypothetical protein